MGVPPNGWFIIENPWGCFGDTPILGNLHLWFMKKNSDQRLYVVKGFNRKLVSNLYSWLHQWGFGKPRSSQYGKFSGSTGLWGMTNPDILVFKDLPLGSIIWIAEQKHPKLQVLAYQILENTHYNLVNPATNQQNPIYWAPLCVVIKLVFPCAKMLKQIL